MKIIISAVACSFLVTAAAYADVVSGDIIKVDVGDPATSAANWNAIGGPDAGNGFTLSSSNLVRFADGVDTGVSMTIENINDPDAGGSIQGIGSDDVTIYGDYFQTWSGRTLVITYAGLDDSLTYDLFGGGLFPDYSETGNYAHTWTVGSDVRNNDNTYVVAGSPSGFGTDGYETFSGLTTDGNGIISFSISAYDGGRPALAELTLTAIPEPASLGLIGACGFGMLFLRRVFQM